MALKYTCVFSVLPEKVQEFLGSCRYQVKKEPLKGLARLSKGSSFGKAAEGVWAAVSHGANGINSVLAIFNRLDSDIMDLDPLVLPVDVLRYPQ